MSTLSLIISIFDVCPCYFSSGKGIEQYVFSHIIPYGIRHFRINNHDINHITTTTLLLLIFVYFFCPPSQLYIFLLLLITHSSFLIPLAWHCFIAKSSSFIDTTSQPVPKHFLQCLHSSTDGRSVAMRPTRLSSQVVYSNSCVCNANTYQFTIQFQHVKARTIQLLIIHRPSNHTSATQFLPVIYRAPLCNVFSHVWSCALHLISSLSQF